MMKDIVAIILLLAFLALVIWFMETKVAGQGRDIPKAMEELTEQSKLPTKVWYATLPTNDDEVAIYRQGKATHVLKLKSIHAMTWVDDPVNGLTRNTIYFSGGQLGHSLDFDDFVKALNKADKQKNSEGLPDIIEVAKEIGGLIGAPVR